MTERKTYSEKLKDPRWQRKRLDILSRDNFKCIICESVDKTLHVHHCFYRKGAEPWEYPTSSLVTLCVDCHQNETFNHEWQRVSFANELAIHGVTTTHINALSYMIFREITQKGVKIKVDIFMSMLCQTIKKYSNETLGGKTNSNVSKEVVSTGEGSSVGDTVERKSDAIV